MCVDYRRLNGVSRADAYPMPRVDDLVDQLGEAKYISQVYAGFDTRVLAGAGGPACTT